MSKYNHGLHAPTWMHDLRCGLVAFRVLLRFKRCEVYHSETSQVNKVVALIPDSDQPHVKQQADTLPALLKRIERLWKPNRTGLQQALQENHQGENIKFLDHVTACTKLYHKFKILLPLNVEQYLTYCENCHRRPHHQVGIMLAARINALREARTLAGQDADSMDVVREAARTLDDEEFNASIVAERDATHSGAARSDAATIAALQEQVQHLQRGNAADAAPAFDGSTAAPSAWRRRGAGRNGGGGRGGGTGRGRGGANDGRQVRFTEDAGHNGAPTGARVSSAIAHCIMSASAAPIDIDALLSGAPQLCSVTRAQQRAAEPERPPADGAGSGRPGGTAAPVPADANSPAVAAEPANVAGGAASAPPAAAPSAAEVPPIAGTPVIEAPAARSRRSRNRKRPTNRRDQGDTCDVSDSAAQQERQERLQALRDTADWRVIPDKVSKTILRSTMVLTLADVIAILRKKSLAEVLLQLAGELQREEAPLNGSALQQANQLSAVMLRQAQADPGVEGAAVMALGAAISAARSPLAPQTAWVRMAAVEAAQKAADGPREIWELSQGAMRTTNVHLSSRDGAVSCRAAFDEGATCCVMTLAALQRAQEDFVHGHPPLTAAQPDTAPRTLILDMPVKVSAFHGLGAHCFAIARCHMCLGAAVYPLDCLVVREAPADIVLGLNFRYKYCRQMPPLLRHHADPLWEVNAVFLGVPRGHGLWVPKYLRNLPEYANAQAADCTFVQRVKLDTQWRPWPVGGTVVHAADTNKFLKEHLPNPF